ncbi:MAG TPA: hypothetical protein VIF11_11705 [Methylomirabilota bacterium]|jgi:CBS-domain-containing membrane protein
MRIDPSEGPGDENAERATPAMARDRMSRSPMTIESRTALGKALALMVGYRIHYLRVEGDERRLVKGEPHDREE